MEYQVAGMHWLLQTWLIDSWNNQVTCVSKICSDRFLCIGKLTSITIQTNFRDQMRNTFSNKPPSVYQFTTDAEPIFFLGYLWASQTLINWHHKHLSTGLCIYHHRGSPGSRPETFSYTWINTWISIECNRKIYVLNYWKKKFNNES